MVLYNTSQNPILTIPLYGYSDSPVAALAPNVGAVINAGELTLSNPYQLALDGAGNIYCRRLHRQDVTRIPAGGGNASVVSFGTPGDPATALQNITGVAVDGAGNLFVGDHQNSRILVVTPGGVVSVLSITGLSPPLGFPHRAGLGPPPEISTLLTLPMEGSSKSPRWSWPRSASSGLGTVLGAGSYSFTGSTLTGPGRRHVWKTSTPRPRTQNNSSVIKVTRTGQASALAIPENITPGHQQPPGCRRG